MCSPKEKVSKSNEKKLTNHTWQSTNVTKKHLKKAGEAHRNIFNNARTTEKLLLIVTSIIKKIKDIGKDDIDDKPENNNR